MKKQVSYKQLFPTVVLLAAFLSLLFSVRQVGAEEAVSRRLQMRQLLQRIQL